jgi:hypothetical protein
MVSADQLDKLAAELAADKQAVNNWRRRSFLQSR